MMNELCHLPDNQPISKEKLTLIRGSAETTCQVYQKSESIFSQLAVLCMLIFVFGVSDLHDRLH